MDAAIPRELASRIAATAAGIDVQVLSPRRGDFNEDLQATGLDDLRAAFASLVDAVAPQEVAPGGQAGESQAAIR